MEVAVGSEASLVDQSLESWRFRVVVVVAAGAVGGWLSASGRRIEYQTLDVVVERRWVPGKRGCLQT